jgi:hypothetical protein
MESRQGLQAWPVFWSLIEQAAGERGTFPDKWLICLTSMENHA